MTTPRREHNEDERLLASLGYRQDLSRRMSGFSNFAISLSIICILAGGITSFHVGLCSVGGASIGLGWPLVCGFSLIVAMTMAQVASAFPTSGGLYHWGCWLGGRGFGWMTAWFNLAGLITVLAAVNRGVYDFTVSTYGWEVSGPSGEWIRTCVIVAMTLSHGLLNHFGIRLTTRLTDLSGWLILLISAVLTIGLFWNTAHFEWSRLWTFQNLSGLPEASPVYPKQTNMMWLFALGFLLPAYTITGFDASAHTSEETIGAAVNVPKGIIRSVAVSGLMGWLLLIAILMAMPSVVEGAKKGGDVVPWVLRSTLPQSLSSVLLFGIILAQYLCGLAALTSASRMTYAFARDGGLPFSKQLASVSDSGSPSFAVWATVFCGVAFTVFVPYTTIAAVCTVFLYISYVLPVAAGFWAYGRHWTHMGPWNLGRWYRPLSALAVVGCLMLLVIGVQPPNDQAIWIVTGTVVLLLAIWFGGERRRFQGPPEAQSAGSNSGRESLG